MLLLLLLLLKLMLSLPPLPPKPQEGCCWCALRCCRCRGDPPLFFPLRLRMTVVHSAILPDRRLTEALCISLSSPDLFISNFLFIYLVGRTLSFPLQSAGLVTSSVVGSMESADNWGYYLDPARSGSR